jgi:hypothetical protein
VIIDQDELYRLVARRWYSWSEEHGQVPVWPPRPGGQVHHMAMTAVSVVLGVAEQAEREVLEDVVTMLRVRAAREPRSRKVLTELARVLEDGSWENQ